MQKYVQEKKTVALGAGFSMLGYVISTLMGFLTNVILYWRFDHSEASSELNIWIIAFSFFAILEPFARLGLSEGVQRFIGVHWVDKDWGRIRGVIKGAFQLSFVASLVMIACVFFLAPHIASHYFADPRSASILCLVLRSLSMYLIPIALTTIAFAILRALNDIRHYVWIETLCQKFGWLMVVILVSFLPPSETRIVCLAYGIIFVNLLSFLISVKYFSKSAPKLKEFQPVYDRKALFFFSFPLVLQAAILVFMKKCDIMMLGYFHNAENYVSQYNAAGISTLIIANILLAFSSLFAPMIAKISKEKDYRRMNELYKTVTRWMLYITLPAAGMMLLFPAQILSVFPHIDPDPMLIATLRILVCAQIVSTLTGHSGLMMIMSGYSRMILYINVLAVFVNVLLNLLLIPTYAMIGAAIATLAAIAVRNSLAVICTAYFMKSQPFSLSTATISLTAVVCGLLAYFSFAFVNGALPEGRLFSHWAFQLALAGFIYAVIYLPATALTMHKDDRSFILDEVIPRCRRALQRKELFDKMKKNNFVNN